MKPIVILDSMPASSVFCIIMLHHSLFQVPAAGISIPESVFLSNAVSPLHYFHRHNIILRTLGIDLPNLMRFQSKFRHDFTDARTAEISWSYLFVTQHTLMKIRGLFVSIKDCWLPSWIHLVPTPYVNEFIIYLCFYELLLVVWGFTYVKVGSWCRNFI